MIKKIIISLLISLLMLNIYNFINQNNYTVQAGIKKGSIQKDFSYTQNVKLPDFHYNTIIAVNQQISNNFIFFGFSANPSTWFISRNFTGSTFREVGLNVYRDVFLGAINEGDVTINQFRDEYEHLLVQTDHFVDNYGYTVSPPPPPPPADDPIVVDLDGNGKPDVSQGINTPHNFFDKSRAVLFDINADGVKDLMEWIGPNDGLLIFFKNDEFSSDVDGFNLMSNAYGFVNGYEKMFEMFDFNKDRILDKSEFSQMYIWQDKNQDAKVQKDELITLEQLGIEKIVLSYGENKMESVMYKKDGSIVKTWQWWPSVYFGIGNK
jgi:hypothetical protein